MKSLKRAGGSSTPVVAVGSFSAAEVLQWKQLRSTGSHPQRM